MKKVLMNISLLALAFNAFAVDETNFSKGYQDKVLPYYHQAKIEVMAGVNKLPIRYQIYKENSKNCLMIFPGRQESIEKYAEVVFDLNHSKDFAPMTVMVVDHRGQGLSGRMIEKNYQIGYVDQFEDYIADVDMLFTTRMQELGCDNHYLLAHSMGGAIGLGLLLKQQNQFKAAVFSAPMWMINTKPYPNAIASMIGGISTGLGAGKKYAVGQKDFDVDLPFAENTTTHSEKRFNMVQNLYRANPSLKVGGVSNRWIKEALSFTRKLRKKADELNLPIAVMQAGEDTFVKNKGQEIVCKKATFCQKYLFPTSKHEILMEQDQIRNDALLIVMRMFADHE